MGQYVTPLANDGKPWLHQIVPFRILDSFANPSPGGKCLPSSYILHPLGGRIYHPALAYP
jgi:hypothetical protein